ncbi:hypothetical protein [Bacillus sp. CH30_1T]|uniref:hypothetical protein n=1 Tax=Bacillus sp. CH30_1T TaxID=2604836 RepID=UPI00165DAC6F|nr:hypothetical protein [Bacillus sp. CH30_1T]
MSSILGRTLAASGAVPLTIQHKPVDRALADCILENNNHCEKSLLISRFQLGSAYLYSSAGYKKTNVIIFAGIHVHYINKS